MGNVIVKNVKKSFSQGGEVTHVLKDIDFSAETGELVMIVGPSGSGKTTLLSVIAGTLKADEGSVSAFGFLYDGKSEQEVARFRRTSIGFIFQQFHLIPTLTCAENVSIPLRLNGMDAYTAMKKARHSLKELGLGGKVDTFPKKLSGGQQQRVAIARALIHDPHLIICDEPTSALDSETGAKIMETIRGHAKSQDRCVLVVTHDARIFKYADRMVQMDDGKISTVVNHD